LIFRKTTSKKRVSALNIVRRLFAIFLVLCLIPFGTVAFADTNVMQNQAVDGSTINQNIVFVDVNGHWANQAISDMAKKGILSGYDDSTFKPEKSITREEFAKIIALTFSLSLDNPSAPTYTDVQPDKWSYNYIESTKDFLTGYYPPKGKAFFSPESQATREDVAVALVKVMGYTTADLDNPNILSYRFNDVNQISVGLRDYVAIATEKQLINGYDDGTFRPESPITRAEVATLLYRVIKSSAQDQSQGPQLDVSVPEKTEDGTYYVSGKTQKDAKIYINDKQAEVIDGEFKEGYKLDNEGSYDVTVVAKIPSGKTTTVHKKIEYKTSGPVLKIDDSPDTVNTEQITLSGTVTDVNDPSPTLYLNDEKMYVSSYTGEFSKDVTLTVGENTFTFKAKDKNDKETTVTKKITFSEDGPVLKISSIPSTSQLNQITVSGSVTDKNDSRPNVYLNDKQLYVDYDGSFSSVVSLEEGDNTLTFKAENKNGKNSIVEKTVTFNIGGPDLKINSLPTSTSSKTVTISGTVKDKNDSRPVVTINDKNVYVDYDGSFSQDFTLNEGTNSFTIKAANANGKESTQTKEVIFNVGGPVLKLSYYPQTTSQTSFTISGTVKDSNDNYPVVYFNDKKLYVDYDGSFDQNFNLSIGANPFTVTASNSFGRTSTVTGVVYRQ
jgi:hypothetical protein